MKFFFDKYKYMLPVLLLVASFLSVFFEYNLYGYILIGNFIGWSIPTSLYFVFEFTLNKKYCLISRLSPVGLLLLNIIDVIGYWFDEKFYNFWYVLIVASLVFSISFIHFSNKLMK